MRTKTNVEAARANFRALYALATPDEIASGRAWYDSARETIVQWANASGRSVANVAALVAVLSPQCDWERNLAAAFALLNGDTVGAGPLPTSVEKARRVLDENLTDTRAVMPTGNKVAAFAANLAGDNDAVTIDTHMVEASRNSPDAIASFPKDAAYAQLAFAVKLAADEVAESPAALQAIVWVVWKRLHPAGRKRAHRRA